MQLALRPHQRLLKRTMDVVGALFGLMVCLPLLVLVALLVRFCLGRPVLYRQLRPGLGGRLFRLYKLRTMTDARDPTGNLLCDSQRLTRLGALLRKTSLDELPELWNELRGEMSLVGPRPLLTEYLPYYTEREAKRHTVRPGIRCLCIPSSERIHLAAFA